MAKIERMLNCDFDYLVEAIEDGILDGNFSASLEDGSDFYGNSSRCSVRIFERYSLFGGNRVSLTVTLYQEDDGYIRLSAVTSGSSKGVVMKLNTIGEETFLHRLEEVLRQV